MGSHVQDTSKVEASTTAVESLLRTLDDAARWNDRTASRVRAFVRQRPSGPAPTDR
jgi:hypothetical protein